MTRPSDTRLHRAQVDLLLDGSFDIWLHSYFLTGLIQLGQAGTIKLCIRRTNAQIHWSTLQSNQYPLLTLRCSAGNGGTSRIICFDPKDQSDIWQTQALDGCDVYFKRSTHVPDTGQLPIAQRVKVRPINPMFATWPSGAAVWTLRTYAAFLRTAVQQIARRQSSRAAIQVMKRSFHNLASLSAVDDYEDTPASPKIKQVLFQTRLWDPAEEKGDWVEDCNQHRVQMVRTLRARLGDRCVGGLICTPYTEKRYPDLLSNLTPTAKSKRPEFIRLCRQFLIRVNIKALFDATPYSLGETLAANNCLVSENIRNNFATPLVAGRHYMGFATADECADRCRELLHSADKANRLREEAYDYYRTVVRPKDAMWSFLNQAMS